MLRRTANGRARVAADPDRRVRLLHRRRQHAVSGCVVAGAIALDALARPGALDREQRIVAHRVAALEVGAEGAELALQVAGGDAQDHPSARHHVQARGRFRHQEWIPIGQHHDVGVQALAAAWRQRRPRAPRRVERVDDRPPAARSWRKRVLVHLARARSQRLPARAPARRSRARPAAPRPASPDRSESARRTASGRELTRALSSRLRRSWRSRCRRSQRPTGRNAFLNTASATRRPCAIPSVLSKLQWMPR